MKLVRWISFFPIATLLALALALALQVALPRDTYSKENFVASVIGLAPLVIKRVIPAAAFVVVGSLVAPHRGRVLASILALVAAVYSMPLYDYGGDQVFLIAHFTSAIVGSVVGLVLVFSFILPREKK